MTCTRTAGSCRLQRYSLAARFEASARRVSLLAPEERVLQSVAQSWPQSWTEVGWRDFPHLSGERNVPSDWTTPPLSWSRVAALATSLRHVTETVVACRWGSKSQRGLVEFGCAIFLMHQETSWYLLFVMWLRMLPCFVQQIIRPNIAHEMALVLSDFEK